MNALSDLGGAHEWGKRTEEGSQRLVQDTIDAITSGSREEVKAAEERLREHSLKPVESALWGWRFGKATLGNPYRALYPDRMHDVEQVYHYNRNGVWLWHDINRLSPSLH
jgi:hypothetical protein